MSKVIKYNPDDWIKKISEDLDGDYQIGLHEVGIFGTNESKKAVRKNNPLTYLRRISPKDYCESIMKGGLLNRWDDISYTLYRFGSVDQIVNSVLRKESFLNYEYESDSENSSKELYDVVVAVPSRITVNGKDYDLGHLSHIEDIDANPEMSMGRRIFSKTNIPKEFIYGYIYKHDGIIEFTANPQYVSMKNMEEQEEFYKKFIEERHLTSIEDERKMQSRDNNKTEEKRGPLEVYKDFLIDKLNNILSLLQEKEDITKIKTSIIPYKKFNFLQKYLFKRKEYREYICDRNSSIKQQDEKKAKDRDRLKEIERILAAEGFPTISSVRQKIESLEKAQNFQELEVDDTNFVIETLLKNGIDPRFESYEQAFEIAPEYLGRNIGFMREAIKKDSRFIMFDKTDDEELYKEVIDKKIDELEKQLSKAEDPDLQIIDELKKLREYKKELESPKKVEEGRYKVPHKFMFEEIKNNEAYGNKNYWYIEVDGIYDKEFGEELEELYERPDIILGIHGLRENKDIEGNIFRQGLRNSMQSADTALNRTVAFGENLTFTKVLNYRIPYNGLECESAIILTLPKETFDSMHPVPVWGSNDITGSDNYILPQYVYGLYHGKSDGIDRRIIRNSIKEQYRSTYKYLKYDSNSSLAHTFIETNVNSYEKSV